MSAEHVVKGCVPVLSRTVLLKLFRKGEVKVGRRAVAPHESVPKGSEVQIFLPDPRKYFRLLTGCEIVHEDNDMLVCDKRAGLPSVGGRGVTADLHSAAEKLLAVRLLAVHRLDAGTSGVLCFAKTAARARALEAEFKQRTAVKVYRAVLSSVPRAREGVIDLPLIKRGERMEVGRGGEPSPPWLTAETRWECVEGARVRVYPKTGRTHQIRVHCAAMGCPLLGDTMYGGAAASRLMLHAESLSVLGKTYTAPLPEGF